MKRLSKSDKAWIDGFFAGTTSHREAEDPQEPEGEYGKADNILQGLANSLNISTRTLHYALQTYDLFPWLLLSLQCCGPFLKGKMSVKKLILKLVAVIEFQKLKRQTKVRYTFGCKKEEGVIV